MSLNDVPVRNPCHLISFLGNESTPLLIPVKNPTTKPTIQGPDCATSLIHGTLAMDHSLLLLSTMTISLLYILQVVIHPRAGCACDLGLGAWATMTQGCMQMVVGAMASKLRRPSRGLIPCIANKTSIGTSCLLSPH